MAAAVGMGVSVGVFVGVSVGVSVGVAVGASVGAAVMVRGNSIGLLQKLFWYSPEVPASTRTRTLLSRAIRQSRETVLRLRRSHRMKL